MISFAQIFMRLAPSVLCGRGKFSFSIIPKTQGKVNKKEGERRAPRSSFFGSERGGGGSEKVSDRVPECSDGRKKKRDGVIGGRDEESRKAADGQKGGGKSGFFKGLNRRVMAEFVGKLSLGGIGPEDEKKGKSGG